MADEKVTPQVPAVQMPTYMQKFVQQSNQDTASMATASVSIPRLSYRGKRWRFVENGVEELVPTLTVKVVILGVEPEAGHMIKTYYKDGYKPGDTDPPTCSSSDGIKPDMWVTSKQANTCMACQQNVFGSATSMSGKKAKACKDSKRLWVAKPDKLNKCYGLNVPTMSLKNLSEYGRFISANKYPLALVVSELGMDDTSEYPKLTFTHAGFVEEAHAEIAIKVNTERPWKSAFADMPLLPESTEAVGGSPLPRPDIKPQVPGTGPAAPQKSVDQVVDQW